MGLLLTGRQINAAEAARWGLVNAVCPAGKVMDLAWTWTEEMLKCSPMALRFTKMVANAALEPDVTRDHVEQLEKKLVADLVNFTDTQEGVSAFLGKRAPSWSGH